MIARPLSIVVGGVLFGFGLALSGMTDPARVIGFLDVTGRWDPTLAFVMGGAVTTFGALFWLWRRGQGGSAWFGFKLPGRNNDPVDRKLVLGAGLFGIGWGMAGFCPGPAIASLVLLRREALLFVPAMAVGMILARRPIRTEGE